MNITSQSHKVCLNGLCRLCGNRAKSSTKKAESKQCGSYSSDILEVFGINVNDDEPELLPTGFCDGCYWRIVNYKRRVLRGGHQSTDGDKSAFIEAKKVETKFLNVNECHDGKLCWVCEQFDHQRKGGRPPKKRVKKSDTHECDIQKESTAQTQGLPAAVTPPRPDKTFIDAQTSPFQFTETERPISIDTCLSKSAAEPLSRIEEKLQTHLVRRKLVTSKEKDVLCCKTGGQSLFFRRVTKARKSSDIAKSPLKKKRSREMSSIRTLISGKTTQSAEVQQVSEIKHISPDMRLHMCNKAGVNRKVQIGKKYSAAMRSFLGLSWIQHRNQKSFLKSMGISFASEKLERKVQKNAIGSYIESELIDLQVKDSFRPVPVVFVNDLKAFVFQLLDKYNETDRLTWHDNNIPENEIWLKIGGDHGGGSFKMSMQVANLQSPNSKHNTIVFNMFPAKDNHVNLTKGIERHINEFKDLSRSEWQGKQIKLFVFGDYDFLSKMYGISGAAGKYPCLWCLTSKGLIKSEPSVREDIDGRTVKQLRKDYKNFKEKGHSELKKASCFHNVIHYPILPVSLSRVCPPYLHILLGIVKKHHTMLENQCHKLDCEIASKISVTDEASPTCTKAFGSYIEQLRTLVKLERRVATINQKIANLDVTVSLQIFKASENKLNEKALKYQNEMSKVRTELKLNVLEGPVADNLDKVLQDHRITPQSYHARALIGNHCAKYLRPQVYEDICGSIPRLTATMTQDTNVITHAYCIRDRFEHLNRLFSQVHNLVSHDNPVPKSEIPAINKAIKQYMSFFRRTFPGDSIIPKMHILEDHVCEWINTWGFGMGLHGEQGGEQIHATLNILKHRVRGMKTEERMYMTMMKEHHLQVSPEIQASLPISNRRK